MEPSPPLNLKKERHWLLALLLISCLVRCWHLVTTEVTARDSIHFIRMAWQLEHEPWKEVLSKATQHPGYPMAIMGLGKLVRPVFPEDLPFAMQISAQLVSAFASLLLIFPLFGLARSLFGPAGAALGVGLVQLLPVTARLFPDGLSEALFLFFVFSGIWLFQIGIRQERLTGLAWSGLFTGCAYLTRPEGGLVLLSCLLVGGYLLLVKQVWIMRRGRGYALAAMSALAIAFMVPAVPYALTIGRLTSKPTATRILQANPVEATGRLIPGQNHRGIQGGPVWAAWYDFKREGAPGVAWGIWATTGMVIRGLLFAFWLPALLAVWKYWDRIKLDPGCLVQTAVAGAVYCALVRVAANLGYVSDRHLVLIVVPALLMAGGFLVDWYRRLWCKGNPGEIKPGWLNLERTLFIVLALVAIVSGAKLTLEPLHANRSGFKLAGNWIRKNGQPGDEVIDPYQWAHYYAGRVFLENTKIAQVRSDPPVHWVVLEKGKSKHVRLNLPQEDQLLAKGAELAFETVEERASAYGGKRLLVYRVPISLPVPAK